MSEETQPYVPDHIVNETCKVFYKREGKPLGKGSFAICYAATERKTGIKYALKILTKKALQNRRVKDMADTEIAIHKELRHKNVVQFHNSFKANDNLHLVLELCTNCSLLQLQQRRMKLSEPEVKYFYNHLLSGVEYIHSKNVVHRDLKLSNLFLDKDLNVKIGDFGIATIVKPGELLYSTCGTPNFLSPEIVNQIGHGLGVDIWAVGCILFILLTGTKPFEGTGSMKTYDKIRNCEFNLESEHISLDASSLIRRIFQLDAEKRPSATEILQDPFITNGYIPKELPKTCLFVEPKFDPELYKNQKTGVKGLHETSSALAQPRLHKSCQPLSNKENRVESAPLIEKLMRDAEKHMDLLQNNLKDLLDKPLLIKSNSSTIGENPDAKAPYWLLNWVDYSCKYGVGYQLCDGSTTVVFNDDSKIILLSNQRDIMHINKDGVPRNFKVSSVPSELSKRMKLFYFFKQHIDTNLVRAGGTRDAGSEEPPYLSKWQSSNKGVFFLLNNGTAQVNLKDHNKLIICPEKEAVTHITSVNTSHTFLYSTIETQGCSEILHKCLKIVFTLVKTIKEKTPAN